MSVRLASSITARLARWQLLGLGPAMWAFVISAVALPFVMYRNLDEHTGHEALRLARAVSLVATTARSYYSSNVVGPTIKNNGVVTLSDRYHEIAGGIPIPATLSIELGNAIRERTGARDFEFRFVSDLPFRHRTRAALDEFQMDALRLFRNEQRQSIIGELIPNIAPGTDGFWRAEQIEGRPSMVRLAVPVLMEANCVACHNSHPDSPARDWQVGDVRGIQEVSVEFDTEGQIEDSTVAVSYLGWFIGIGMLALREHRSRVKALNRLNSEMDLSRQVLQDNSLALEQSIRDLRTKTTVLEMAPFGILVMSPQGEGLRIEYVNQAFCESMGYEPSEVAGRLPSFLHGEATDPKAIAEVNAALSHHRSVEVEMVSYTRGGDSRIMRWLVFPSYGVDGSLLNMVACLTDVTDMRRSENERQQMASELQESTKLESLALAIAGIAHDLNTPIGVALTASTVVQQSSAKLIQTTDAPTLSLDEIRRLAARIEKSADMTARNLVRAGELVKSFKETTADATRVEWRRLRLASLLESLATTMSPVMRRARCKVVVNCPPELELFTEPGALTQAVTNLMVNATLHAFGGIEHRVVTIDAEEVPDGVALSVADNGQGMSDEAALKAFTPFFTTRRNSGGSGLGLFSSRRAVEQVLRGRITFQTALGKGTRFTIFLPRLTSAPEPADEGLAPPSTESSD